MSSKTFGAQFNFNRPHTVLHKAAIWFLLNCSWIPL